ncbi:MAG TPA: alpha/beta hydrolase [Cellulomonas sp.]
MIPVSADHRPAPRTRHRRRAAVALASVAALLLAGCVGAKQQTDVTATSTGSATGGDVQGLDAIYAQQLDWSSCGDSGDDIECATVVVPLDWDDPEGDTITLEINRHQATGDSLGSLLINPGGPGGSGLDALASIALDRFGDDVIAQYDLIGFDPRGVGESTPVTCVDGETMDTITSTDFDYSTDEGIAAAEAAYGAVGAGCLESTGSVLEHVDTVSAAKDMDVIRAVLGDDTLNYVGYSYGTQLGATYAALFPDTVGRMVLDGAVDPTLSSQELALGQAVGFENALRAYVEDCQAGSDCPMTGSVDDGMAQIKALLDRARQSPLSTGTSRELTGALAFTGIAVTLYDETSWSYLTMGLSAALNDADGSVLLALSDIYYDRDSDGTYSTNSTEAFWAIGCADDRGTTDVDQMRTDAAEIEAAAPTVGYFFGYGGTICAQWPVAEAGGLDDYSAEGAAPIVVIGTTNDPATPYEWAESLAQTLSSGTLLTYEGEGHTAYGRSNSCILDAVDDYLIDGTVPAEGTTC